MVKRDDINEIRIRIRKIGQMNSSLVALVAIEEEVRGVLAVFLALLPEVDHLVLLVPVKDRQALKSA